jgi:ribosomal protein S18 acetylase RimI-like enzyme
VIVEPLIPADVPDAARVLTRAFRDNPGMLAIFRGDSPERREKLLEPCMVGFTQTVLRWGIAEVVRDAGEVLAVSLSFPPGGFPAPLRAQLVTAKGPLLAGPARALRFARLDHEMRRWHPHYRHFYLWFLGVDPSRQGRGLGSALLHSLSNKAASQELPCYLETDKQSSVRLYERHGYVVEAERVLPGLELRLWFMRKPAPLLSRD